MKKIILMMVVFSYLLLANDAILSIDTGGHTAMIKKNLIVSKSGDIISASADKSIRVWDSRSGKEKRKILGEIGAGSEGNIFAIALSSDERYLAVGGYFQNNEIRIYDYRSGKLLKLLKSHTNVVNDLAFSDDSKYLLSGSGDYSVKLWSMKDMSLIRTIDFHTNDVYGVKFAKNNTILSAGLDNRIAMHSFDGKLLKSYTHSEKLMYLAINDEEIAVCGYGHEILIFDMALNLKSKIQSETVPLTLAYSPNKRFLIAGVGNHPMNVNIYDVKNNHALLSSFDKHTNATQAVGWLDNQTAVSGGGDNNEIYIWDKESKEVKSKIVGLGQSVWSVGVNGESIAWGNVDDCSGKNCSKLQKSFNLKTLQLSNSASESNFKRINANGLMHSKGGDYGRDDAVLKIDSSGVAITKDSTTGYRHNCYGWYKDFIISGGGNGQLKIYDTRGVEVASLVGHTGMIWSIALDGDRLVSGSCDQTIKIWDLKPLSKGVKTLYPTVSLFVGSDNEWVMWSKEGFFNASKDGAKYIGYHINQGSDKEAEFLDIRRFQKHFYRPDLIAKALGGEDISSYAPNVETLLSQSGGGLPPLINILTSSRTINDDETTIGVKVCDNGGGMENLNFYIDDKPIRYLSQTRAFREKKEMVGGCIVLEQKLSIPYGKHIISFNATNKNGDIGSNTDKIKITNKKAQISKPNLHILTLSISDYKDNSLDLKYPNNDADKIAQKLQIIGKPIFSNIYNYALKDAQVTQSSILKTIEDISSKINSDDVFILYIAGHGVTSSKDGDYYFIPFDCKNGDDVNKYAINQAKFKEYIAQIKAVKSAIFIDTCQSGTMASKDLLDTSINRFGGNVGIAIIAGASSKQDAIDGYKEHGIFSYTVLDAMNNEKVYSFDDKLSINEIAEYTKYILPKLAKEQFNHEQKPTIYLNGDTTFAVGGVAK
ncbi:MAG: hypothetical protein FNT15_06865 [Sulfurovum sp.]|nr:MAG: hypothetical protein FNT15_06865 [Sulfurovum sp.]